MLQDARDWVIIISGSLSIILFLILVIMSSVIGLGVRSLLSTVQKLVREEVTPLVDQVGQTVKQVRGTTSFVSETSVRPIIRVYGIVAGTRRFVGVVSGISGRRRKGREGR